MPVTHNDVLPMITDPQCATLDLAAMARHARSAAQFLKALAHEQRLLILCHLTQGECSVGELEGRLAMRQAHLSQQLARLRQDGLVRTRRSSRTIFYRLASEDAQALLDVLYERFCKGKEAPRARRASASRPAADDPRGR